MEQMTRDDLAPVLEAHPGNRALQAALESATTPPRMLSILGRYIQFNAAFGPGVANLAGEIAARPDLFRDAEEPVHVLADRAAEVGADFFYAGIDEFDDRATAWRDTHRTLAQATLKGVGQFYGFSPPQLNEHIRINAATTAAIPKVYEGYGLGMRLSEEHLFRSMGFHVGSEILADQEFVVIDKVLHARQPDLVFALENMKVPLLGERHDAYYWIRIHTGVEAEHFDAALKGVNKALRYYAGTQPQLAIKEQVLAGFRHFARVQGAFMADLGSD